MHNDEGLAESWVFESHNYSKKIQIFFSNERVVNCPMQFQVTPQTATWILPYERIKLVTTGKHSEFIKT